MSDGISTQKAETKGSNRLIHETSPYLLQHAHNPVNWYPWGQEALQESRKSDKPILLSIGYAACHWCHVMAHESFEDNSTAQIMNENFINIKVDREERPDLDEVYMRSVQAMTGHGGWPMTVFLTPQLKPFFGGTYFPPQEKHGLPSFKNLLNSLIKAWEEQRQQIETSSTQLTSYLSVADFLDQSTDAPRYEQITTAVEHVLQLFDRQFGGLGNAPKFPHPFATDLIMRAYQNRGTAETLKQECREFIFTTLNRMAFGGMHDQIGGGFARYSVDRQWLIPHFEKMLYDNAALSKNYFCGYQLFGQEYWKDVATNCLDFVAQELTTSEGAFYSSLDADSEGHEGKFYVWTPSEIIDVLGKSDADWVNNIYGVSNTGNFEHGTTALHLTASPEELAKQSNIGVSGFWARLNPLRQKLLDARSKRVRPGRDEKVLTSWNALMISSFVKGYQVTGNADYLKTATGAAHFILSNMHQGGRLARTWSKGKARLNGYLDDYTFMTQALLDLASVDASPTWLDKARQLNDCLVTHFYDESTCSFFYTSDDHEELIMRTRNHLDGPIPSGTSVAVMNLLRLSRIFDDGNYYEVAKDALQGCTALFEKMPDQLSNMLCAIDFYLSDNLELVLAAYSSSTQQHQSMLLAANSIFLPNLTTALIDSAANDTIESAPLFSNRVAQDNKTTAYLCHNYTCQKPIVDPKELSQQLHKVIDQ